MNSLMSIGNGIIRVLDNKMACIGGHQRFGCINV